MMHSTPNTNEISSLKTTRAFFTKPFCRLPINSQRPRQVSSSAQKQRTTQTSEESDSKHANHEGPIHA
jgi:hypothetical protein